MFFIFCFSGACTELVLVDIDLFTLSIETVLDIGGYYSFIADGKLVFKESSNMIQFSSPPPDSTIIDGYLFSHTTEGPYTVYELSLDDGQFVRVTDLAGLGGSGGYGVLVRGKEADFGETTGMCGDWDDSGIIDPQAWATLYGVGCSPSPSEACCCLCPMDPADVPELCGEGFEICGQTDPISIGCEGPCVDAGEARLLCEDKIPEDLDDDLKVALVEQCLFDIATTADVTFADAPFYSTVPADPIQDQCQAKVNKNGKSNCAEKGGVCVVDCEAGDGYQCVPGLCDETVLTPEGSRCACKRPKPGNGRHIRG